MSPSNSLVAGIDVGASRTKVVILDGNKKMQGYSIKKSGVNFGATVNACFHSALNMAGAERGEVSRTFSTGYGRLNVTFRQGSRTEIC